MALTTRFVQPYLALLTLLLPGACTTPRTPAATSKAIYRYRVNLRRPDHDRLRVEVQVPPTRQRQVVFVMPKSVPGIYGALNFGRYVTELTALGPDNEPLPVTRQDTNSWVIADARRLRRLTYSVADTWDQFHHVAGEAGTLYRSAGSAYQPDSAYVLNYNTFVGYLEGHARPYEVRFTRPAGYYGASHRPPQPLNDSVDVVRAPSYRALVDAPVLYARPDTAWLHLGQTKVLVALYATTQRHYAPTLARSLKPLLEAQRAYLGGRLPVDSYAFLVYHAQGRAGSYLGDGLEHSQSTLCLLESPGLADLGPFLRRLTTHEFFHIVTPLNIHSREIESYDFRQPTFSAHLWLYEGLTEYATVHMAIRQRLQTLPEFVAGLESKARDMRQFDNTLALTELSRLVLTRPDQYYNFYLKGALFNLCLDVRLRELSGGTMGTQELVRRLARRYGPSRPFADEELFDVITELTYPAMRGFFRAYLEQGQPLPLAETLAKVGLRYEEKTATISIMAQLTPAQRALRRAWIGQ